MSRTQIHLVCCALVLGLVLTDVGGAADPNLLGWWRFDDGGGTTAVDSSGQGNNGTLRGNPQWITGQLRGALSFNGSSTYVEIPYSNAYDRPAQLTLAAWVNPTTLADWCGVITFGINNSPYALQTWGDGAIRLSANWGTVTGGVGSGMWNSTAGQIKLGQWQHIAVTYDGAVIRFYRNGLKVSEVSVALTLGSLRESVLIGADMPGGDEYFNGGIDDPRIYNSALSDTDIQAIMLGLGDELATTPDPKAGATDVPRDATLGWMPGAYAKTHDVYLGTNRDDVKNATRANSLNVLAIQDLGTNTYDPPGRFEFGQTYYWRIDEVNGTPDHKIFPGKVWSFTAEAYSYPIPGVTASASSTNDATTGAEKTVDGSGLDANDEHSAASADMWLSGKGIPLPHWIEFAFDKVYKLDQMWVWNSNQILEAVLGMGAKDVAIQYSTDAVNWTDLGSFVFTRAAGTAPCAADTKVDFGGAPARYVKLTISSNWGGIIPQSSLSEVRFYYKPVAAQEPAPADGATNVNPQVTLSWRAGREADSHEVYVSTDPNAVADGTAPMTTVSQAKHEVPLNLENTYYWKVVEVNQAETPCAWPSDVWSFSTAAYVSVDDFESYTNNSPKRVFQTWIDGSGFSPDPHFPNGDPGNGTGALVGYDPLAGDIMETAYAYGGSQSTPLYYDNGAAPRLSEAVRTFDPPQDWTKHGITTLVLFFRGDPNNAAAPVYVKINDTKLAYNNGAASTTTPVWKQWNINLASMSAAELNSVKSLTIGVGDGSAGGTGRIFIDEIRLYATAPAVVVPTDPGTNGLAALYSMEDNVDDSSGNNLNGTANGDPSYLEGAPGYGKALAFDGVNDYVDLPIGSLVSSMSSASVAAWVYFTNTGTAWQRVFDFGTGTTSYMFLTTHNGTPGRTRFAITIGGNAVGVEQILNGPAALPIGWHHLAGVIDGTAMTLRLYQDGTPVTSGATTVLPKNLGVTTRNWLGRSQYTGDPYFNGSLDDFRIYNRVLTEGELHYLAGDR
jgi:hypothetical protein